MGQTKVSNKSFGQLPDGSEAQLYTLESPDVILTVTSFGARVVELHTKDREGTFADISLGYGDADAYATRRNTYFGATIGRLANRLAHGEFSLDGKPYKIPAHNGPNALHGGPMGFDRRSWTAIPIENGVEFKLTSEDGDQGFPGTLHATASYELNGDTVTLRYRAETDQPTVVNLTNHTYFNLGGEGAASILDHELTLYADSFTPISDTLIPTGEIARVGDTPFDFTSPRQIGSHIGTDVPQLLRAKGYDHNFVLRGTAGELRPAARLRHPASGRELEVSTTEPGVQFYSGNFLDGSLTGRSGKAYGKRSALCLETQHFPDSPNHPQFPSTELRPDEVFQSETTWRFAPTLEPDEDCNRLTSIM